jgi:hypothetical protein
VALLAAASAAGVAGAALGGSGTLTAETGGGGAVVTLAAAGIARLRRHRASHRLAHASATTAAGAESPFGIFAPSVPEQRAVEIAMSAPPAPPAPMSVPAIALTNISSWAPPTTAAIDLRDQTPASVAPSLFLVPEPAPAWVPDPMVDTVPHPVVKLFPLAELEPELASGSIDERVYAAFDAERMQCNAAQLAGGKHASTKPTDAAAPRNVSYRSRHSA